jgi:hypothetical protein
MMGMGEMNQGGRISCVAAGGSTSKLEDRSVAGILQGLGGYAGDGLENIVHGDMLESFPANQRN